MESVLHAIDELKRIADDLVHASSGGVDRDRYEADCELFLERIEEYSDLNARESHTFITAKLSEVRASLGTLLREDGAILDLSRYQSRLDHSLNGIYRSLRKPVVAQDDDIGYDI